MSRQTRYTERQVIYAFDAWWKAEGKIGKICFVPFLWKSKKPKKRRSDRR